MNAMKSMAMLTCGLLLSSVLIRSHGTVFAGVKVIEEVPAPPEPKTFSPVIIYADTATTAPYAPTGWMGSKDAITFNDRSAEDPHSGPTCIKVEYKAVGDWGGIVWQNPENDWGDKPGGFNLTGATRITFWARGAAGGEKVEFYFGVIKSEKPYSDSDNGRITVILTKDWKQYTIDLSGKNLTRIKTGFGWSLAGQGKPVTFYLDDIQYE
jgi:hypothetical protein